MDRATGRQLVGIIGLLAVAGSLGVVFSPRAAVVWLTRLQTRPVLFGFVLVVVYIVRPFVLWPMSAVPIAVGYLYGPRLGIPVGLAGAVLTVLPPYLIGRYAQTDLGLFGYIGNSGQQLVDTVGETRSVIAARWSPVPGDPVSYAAGLSEISLGPFLLGTLIGELPWTVGTVLMGASMRSLSLSGVSISPQLIAALAFLAGVVVAGPVYRKRKGMQS